MDEVEIKLLITQELQPLVWFRCIDDIFFIWNHNEDELNKFLENLNLRATLNLRMKYQR